MGRLPGLRLHPQPRAQGLEQRPSVSARDRGGQPVPEAPAGAARREDPPGLLAARPRGSPSGRDRIRSPGSRQAASFVQDARHRLEDTRCPTWRREPSRSPTAACFWPIPRTRRRRVETGRHMDLPDEARGRAAWPGSAWNCCRTRHTAARSPAARPRVPRSGSRLRCIPQGPPQDRPVAFFHAEADQKEPRYFNGHEILDIRGLADGEAAQGKAADRRSGTSTLRSSWPATMSSRSW